MIRAAYMMSSFKKYNSSRHYESLRQEYIKNFMIGDKNPIRRFPWNDEQKKYFGEVSRGRKWVNNGVDSCMAKDEKLDELLKSGWILGRLRTKTLIEGAKKGGKRTGGHNKGVSMSAEQREKCKGTFFKKGQVPHNKKQTHNHIS